jgi:hypothetical protein
MCVQMVSMLARAGKTGAWRDAFVTTDLSVLAKTSQRKMGYGATGVSRPRLDVDASVTRG